MAFGPEILVKFLADTKELVNATSKVESQGSKLKSFGKVAAGAFGTAAILKFGKDSIGAAQESAVATARLENVFRSMGDTTGDAASAAEKYASSLSRKIGVDDEAIMAAQAQLATFGKVSDATARQAGIFDRATAAAADLAAAGFGSLDTNSVQLGKALQDPIKGITALAKSGVTFTQQQKDQIAALVKTGDTLGAQKIVLGAVEGQVKGTAAATATSQDKMRVAFGETQEKIGGALLPVVNLLTNAFAKYSDILIPLAGVIVGVVVATKAAALATEAWEAAQVIATAAQWLWNAAMEANPIGFIVLALIAVIAAIVLAYKKVSWFHDLVDVLWQGIQTAFHAITGAAGSLMDWFKSHWPLLLAILTGPIGLAVLAITRNWDTLKNAAAAVVKWVTDKFSSLVSFFKNLVHDIASAVGTVVDAIKGPINAVIRGLNQVAFTIPRIEIGVGPTKFGAGPWHVDLIPFTIPQLASGGVTTSEGLAWLHPAEVITPMSSAPGGDVYITVNVPPTANPVQVGRAIVDAIRQYETVAGTSWRMAPTGT